MTKIAFLGAGRMASAMVGGLLTKAAATPADLACTSGPDDTAQQLSARTGIALHTDLAPLLADANTVVVACKPQQLASLDPRLAELTAGSSTPCSARSVRWSRSPRRSSTPSPV